MTRLQELARLGQSIWLDYLRRSFTESGELQALIDKGLRGVTSNPSIFEKAIAGSNDYDEDLRSLGDQNRPVEEIYEALAIADIPDEPGAEESSITFGVLKMAQALGDRQALEDAGRRVITFHLGDDVVEGLESLTRSLG